MFAISVQDVNRGRQAANANKVERVQTGERIVESGKTCLEYSFLFLFCDLKSKQKGTEAGISAWQLLTRSEMRRVAASQSETLSRR